MSASQAEREPVEDVEVALLLEGLYRIYGFDFREYSPASIKRRIKERVIAEKVPSISCLQDLVLRDEACLERLLVGLPVHVTSMFRDPSFYLTFRSKIVPVLRTYPTVRIWHAGCSTGEEVYSMIILLHEEGLHRKSIIYATDISNEVLRRAREGIFPLSAMQEYTSNYMKAGGKHEFSDYYTADSDNVIFHSSLKSNVVFSEHNLVTDGSFNEFHVILCRNVMIYFNKTLQERVHNLIYESLSLFGYLGLGNKESLRLTPRETYYEKLDSRDKLYRKVR